MSGECDNEVFQKGASVCLVDIPKETAEDICRSLSAVTGCRIDWHYIGGRVHIKALSSLAMQVSTLSDISRCLGFFASAIKSGEPWTDTCQREYDTALAALQRLNVQSMQPKQCPRCKGQGYRVDELGYIPCSCTSTSMAGD